MASYAPPSVIIVGGGPVGLSSSILLSVRSIPHVLIERHPGTSIHPKACGINQRTMEIFRTMGVEDEIYRQAAPSHVSGRTAWYTGFGKEGREIISRDAWGGGRYAEEYAGFSASRYCLLPQMRLEPILKRRAEELNPGGIMFNTEALDVRDQGDGVDVQVKFRDTGKEDVYGARYVLIADGGRIFTNKLGMEWKGEKDILDMVTAHFASPLHLYHPDPRNFITWFSNPDMGGSTRTGYLYQIGPWPVDRVEDQEWVFACGRTEDDPAKYDEASMIKRLRKTLGLPDLPVRMLSFSHWKVNAMYAERWRSGRVFLLGDSAHRIPPWGALGMNTGIQDAQNLIWKIQLALGDEVVYDRLLDTYASERLEIGRRVAQTSAGNMRSHSNVMDQALGMSLEKSKEENREAIAPFFDPQHPDHERMRNAVDRAQKILDSEFKAPGGELGWFYPSVDFMNEGAVDHGGQVLPGGSLNTEFYFPSTIPGHHLPHCELEKDGKTIPIRDLVPLSTLALIYEEAATQELPDERVLTVHIGPGGYRDTSGSWRRVCGVSASGGVLVRPDGIVAWRGDLVNFSRSTWRALVDRVLHYRM